MRKKSRAEERSAKSEEKPKAEQVIVSVCVCVEGRKNKGGRAALECVW